MSRIFSQARSVGAMVLLGMFCAAMCGCIGTVREPGGGAPRMRIRATLTAKSETLTFADIAPHRSAMIVYEYDVDEVLKGTYTREKIRVTDWCLIEEKPTGISKAELGSQVVLVLELFEEHPELSWVPIRDTLKEDFEMPLYIRHGIKKVSKETEFRH